MAKDTFETNDPFNVMSDQQGTTNNRFIDSEDTTVFSNNPFMTPDGHDERVAEGAFGNFSQLSAEASDQGFFRKPMGEFEATEADWVDQLKMAAGMMFTFDEQDQIDIIKSTLPDANIRVDDGGNAIVSYRGEEGFVNKPDASWRDFASVAGTLLSFTPAFRTAKYATTVAGKSAIVGVANTMTDVGLQGTVQALGGEKEADVERALIAGVIGGGSIAAVDKVAKIAAPLIKAHGVKGANKVVEKVGLLQRRFEQRNMNPEEALDRALRTMRLSTVEGEAAQITAGKSFTKATPEALRAHDAKLLNRLGKTLKESPLGRGLDVMTEKSANALIPIQGRIAEMAPEIGGGLRRTQHAVHSDLIATEGRIDDFVVGMSKLKKANPEGYRSLKQSFVANDANTIEKLMNEQGMKVAYEDVRIVLDEIQDLRRAGGASAEIKNFFPRGVKDYTKLSEVLTGKEFGAISTAVERAEVKAAQGGRNVDQLEISKIVNRQLKLIGKEASMQSRTGNRRTMSRIQDDMLDHYEDPESMIQLYLRDQISKKHKQVMFSNLTKEKNLNVGEIEQIMSSQSNNPAVRDAMIKAVRERGNKMVDFDQDVNTSITNMLHQHALEGKLLKNEESKVASLLKSVLINSSKPQSPIIQDVKNIFYTSTLGNFLSTLTQFGDVGVSGVLNEVTPTVVSFIKTTPKVTKGGIRAEEVGIALDRVTEEMVSNTRKTADMLDWVLNKTGFKGVDRWGKRTFINAAHIRLQKESLTARGVSKIRDKYKNSFTEEEFHKTVESLRAGRVDDNVKFMLWNELSDAQPITMLEMPQFYANHPNGRIMYMLKTFTLKQLDIMRRTAFDDIAAGRVGKGVKQLGAHNAMMLAAGASVETIKDMIRGREVDVNDKIISGVYRNFGQQEGMGKTLFGTETSKASISKTAARIALPPISIADTAWDDMMHFGKQFNSFKNLQVVGQLMYIWWGGVIEESNERLEKRIKERKE